MKFAVEGHELEILLAILSEFSTQSGYEYIYAKTNQAVVDRPSGLNSTEYYQAIAKLHDLGMISVDSSYTNLRPKLIRNKLCISVIYEDFHTPTSTHKEGIMHWRKLTAEQKHNYSAVFGAALFRLIIFPYFLPYLNFLLLDILIYLNLICHLFPLNHNH